MLILWRLGQAFVREIRAEMDEPKPHYNTVSTTVRVLEEKGFIGHTAVGNKHKYHPLVTQDVYKGKFMNRIVDNYFANSFKNMVSYFTKKEQLSKADLEEIIRMIENGEDE